MIRYVINLNKWSRFSLFWVGNRDWEVYLCERKRSKRSQDFELSRGWKPRLTSCRLFLSSHRSRDITSHSDEVKTPGEKPNLSSIPAHCYFTSRRISGVCVGACPRKETSTTARPGFDSHYGVNKSTFLFFSSPPPLFFFTSSF
jgi:hypothetical protein